MRRTLVVQALLAIVVCAALGESTAVGGSEDAAAADEALLKRRQVGTGGPELLAFLRERSLTAQRREHLEAAVRQLGSAQFAVREEASRAIVALGPPALPLLRRSCTDPDREIARRAEACIDTIEQQHGSLTALPAAVVRLLALRKPAGAAQVLLTYLPFADDEGLEEEILSALCRVGLPQGKADPALLAAVEDAIALKRAAAGYVVGRSAEQTERAAVLALLQDPDEHVRLRAAQGLLGGKEKQAIPVLIDLLGRASPTASWRAEELLYRIAGEQGPRISLGNGKTAARQKCQEAWTSWWQAQGTQVDLTHLEDEQRQLGLTLLAEMDSNKVWEFGPDGKVRWRIDNLQGPMDAQVLPGARVLVAEYQGQRVTERDFQGNVLWEKRTTGNPITCQRLANGNTFIATHNTLLEVTPDGREVYSHHRAAGVFLFGAQKLRHERIICITSQGVVLEIDASTGKDLRSFRQSNNLGGWCGVESLANGRFLLAIHGSGKVLEVDETGKTLWECAVPGACHATRLPNGHTLVACMATRRVVEVDRNGKTVLEVTTEGRPWRVHRR